MRTGRLTGGILFTMAVLMACFGAKKETPVSRVLQTYQQDIGSLADAVAAFISAIEKDVPEQTVQQRFRAARKKYKELEWLAEYYTPYTAKHINGPALAEVEPEDRAIILQPEGFQVVEPFLFPHYDRSRKDALLHEARLLRSNVGRLQATAATLQPTDAHILDALRLEVFRIIALGLSGFDSPVANHSLPEAASALHGLQKNISFYYSAFAKADTALSTRLENGLLRAQQFLNSQTDFNAFDRMAFIITYLNPLSENLWAFQKVSGLPFFSESRALKATAKTLFSKDAFNPDFYAPDGSAYATSEKAALGKKLFYDTRLSKNGTRSCATCHQPEKAFTDGLQKANTFDGKAVLPRNTPTLLNAALQPSLFYDARVSYLEDQANAVITNKDEMHGSLADAVRYLEGDDEYLRLFEKAYANGVITEAGIKNAIASYVRSLVALNARFDQYMRGQKEAMDRKEIQGFNLFMGKAKCGTCHFVPLFNGVNPPAFAKTDAEIIGVPATADTSSTYLDADIGKYNVHKIPLHKNAFKTPTLRNSALTAPYMHNGVFETLEEVIDFYDRGGGNGLGLNIENQTLPAERLRLSSGEKDAVIAFLNTLTDTSFSKHR